MISLSALFPLVAVVLGALAVLLLEAFRKNESRSYLGFVAIAFLAACGFLAAVSWDRGRTYFRGALELDRLADGRKRFKGGLVGVEDGAVALNAEGEAETILIPFAWITEAKLVLTDELMKRGAEARAARLEHQRASSDAHQE